MTRVYERAGADGPVTRALVIGVGAYPHAKPANANPDGTTPRPLRNVKDLQSAALGAVLFTDWLIANADKIEPPLASVDLLLNMNVGIGIASAYEWESRIDSPGGGLDPRAGDNVDPPTTLGVKTAGRTWRNQLTVGNGHSAILYICGHGAIFGADNIVFLADLNEDPANPWGALLNVQQHASALKQIPALSSAHFFVDACGEAIQQLALNPGVGAQFAYADPDLTSVEKVAILAAAAPKKLTYEGTVLGQDKIYVGRFTQCLLQALGGAAVRDESGSGTEWVVHSHGLFDVIKPLYQLRQEWNDRPFEPVPPMLPAARLVIVRYPDAPDVPVKIQFQPPRPDEWTLGIYDTQNGDALIDGRERGPAVEWLTAVPASLWPYLLRADSDTENLTRTVSTIQGVFDHVL